MSSIDLRLGPWEDVLAGVECDFLCTDAPYSDRTHSGHDAGAESVLNRETLNYRPWTAEDVHAFVASWAPRTRGWFVSITDHVLAPAWAEAFAIQGRYVFSPIACVEPGSRVRVTGDGPAQWSVWAIAARPRTPTYAKWGSLPGAYVVPKGQGEGRADRKVIGGKPLWLMRALVRDYSRHGDVVCDPCAGGGTTLLAAAIEHRKAIGSEELEGNYRLARARFDKGYTATLGL